MKKYQVVESKCWQHKNGHTASIFSIPWTNPDDEQNWQMVTRGYTIRNLITNTVGLGRKPFKTYQEAQEKCEELNHENA